MVGARGCDIIRVVGVSVLGGGMSAALDFERLLHFETGDIPYNRRGELSPRQRQVLRSDARGRFIYSVFAD